MAKSRCTAGENMRLEKRNDALGWWMTLNIWDGELPVLKFMRGPAQHNGRVSSARRSRRGSQVGGSEFSGQSVSESDPGIVQRHLQFRRASFSSSCGRAGGVDWCKEASKSTAGSVRAIVGECRVMNPRTEEDDDIFVKLWNRIGRRVWMAARIIATRALSEHFWFANFKNGAYFPSGAHDACHAPNPDSFIRYPSEMTSVFKKAFQRVSRQTSSHEQPILCKFCGKRVRDASYTANGSVMNGPKSKMAHNPETGVTVIWHKSCHRADRAGSEWSILVRLILVAAWNWKGVPCFS